MFKLDHAGLKPWEIDGLTWGQIALYYEEEQDRLTMADAKSAIQNYWRKQKEAEAIASASSVEGA